MHFLLLFVSMLPSSRERIVFFALSFIDLLVPFPTLAKYFNDRDMLYFASSFPESRHLQLVQPPKVGNLARLLLRGGHKLMVCSGVRLSILRGVPGPAAETCYVCLAHRVFLGDTVLQPSKPNKT